MTTSSTNNPAVNEVVEPKAEAVVVATKRRKRRRKSRKAKVAPFSTVTAAVRAEVEARVAAEPKVRKEPLPFVQKTKKQARAYLKQCGLSSTTLPGRGKVLAFSLTSYDVTVSNVKGKFYVARKFKTVGGNTTEAMVENAVTKASRDANHRNLQAA